MVIAYYLYRTEIEFERQREGRDTTVKKVQRGGTNDELRATNDERRTTSDEQRVTNKTDEIFNMIDLTIKRPVGAAADAKELQYVAALHQTCDELDDNFIDGSIDGA